VPKDFYAALDCAITKLDGRFAPLGRPSSRAPRASRARLRVGRHRRLADRLSFSGSEEHSSVATALAEHDEDQPWRIVRERSIPLTR